MKWVQVRIPAVMMKEIQETIGKKPLWVNEHDFIRDAIREKLCNLASEALLHYVKTEKLLEETSNGESNSPVSSRSVH